MAQVSEHCYDLLLSAAECSFGMLSLGLHPASPCVSDQFPLATHTNVSQCHMHQHDKRLQSQVSPQ